MFISFEGPEGCGKSTQAEKLKDFLEGRGLSVLLTREPGGTAAGKHIREILLDPETALSQMTELYLFAADRAEHVNKVIRPALAEGRIVICDRFTDSTLAYQIGGRGMPAELVGQLNGVSAGGLVPDLTILLDVAPEVGIRRAAAVGAPDRFEKERLDFHARVREKYLRLAEQEPRRIKVIPTDGRAIDEVWDEIRRAVEKAIHEK